MEFGVFYQLPCAADQSPGQRYADTIAQIQLADQLGFSTAWLAELHFHPRFSILASPLLLASAIAQTTRRIKLGTAVNLMPLHHPIRLAEETATLDILSQGRAIFGIGRGIIPSHFEGYGVSMEEGRDRFFEAVELVLKAWTNDELSYDGKYYQAQDLQVVPKPFQKPHPPVYVAATGPDTFGMVGTLGFNLLVAPLISTNERAQEGLAVYKEKLAEAGRDPSSGKITVAVPVVVSEDRKKAQTHLETTVRSYVGSIKDMMWSPAANRAAKVNPRIQTMQDGLSNLTFERIRDQNSAVGEPQECVERLQEFQEMLGPQEFMCWFNTGGMLPHEEVEKSMRLFVDKVMPELVLAPGH
jgi:natural product biosynthesis luciferase-like monooxygenase protein